MGNPAPGRRGARPVAVVTGGSRGLGFLIARELARHGYDLVLCARSADGLRAAETDLAGTGVQVATVAADVGKPDEARSVVAEAERRFGRLDVLVLNAGVIQVGPAAVMSEADYAEAMDVMFWGALHVSTAAMPLLRRSRGNVLAVTSVGGKLPAPHLLPYTAAKHAAVGFAEGLPGRDDPRRRLGDGGRAGPDAHRLPPQRAVQRGRRGGEPVVHRSRQPCRSCRWTPNGRRGGWCTPPSAGARRSS
jgi:NAD(P)-dependent dehydrogenase (short-subunit alcohol dehydrogenase family)